MTDNNHPITPPSELVTEWWNKSTATQDNLIDQFATQAARWGADQELESCCELVRDNWQRYDAALALRAARRPKPMSLKEEALAEMELLETEGSHAVCMTTLRRAIESLPS